jgi:hypothetical protein
MVDEKARRRAGFQEGTWVRMGDGQDWMLPPPPVPGLDPAYDGLIRCRDEAEDGDEALRIELALAITQLARNYDPSPEEYAAIFGFGADQGARSRARAAISELINDTSDQARSSLQAAPPGTTPHQAGFRTLGESLASGALRVQSAAAARRH